MTYERNRRSSVEQLELSEGQGEGDARAQAGLAAAWDEEAPSAPFELCHGERRIVWDGEHLRLQGAQDWEQDGAWDWEDVVVKLSRSLRPSGCALLHRFSFPGERAFLHVELQHRVRRNVRLAFSALDPAEDGSGLPWLEARGVSADAEGLAALLPALRASGASMARAENGRAKPQKRVMSIQRSRPTLVLGLLGLLCCGLLMWWGGTAFVESLRFGDPKVDSFNLVFGASVVAVLLTLATFLGTRIWFSSTRVSIFALGFRHLPWSDFEGIQRTLDTVTLKSKGVVESTGFKVRFDLLSVLPPPLLSRLLHLFLTAAYGPQEEPARSKRGARALGRIRIYPSEAVASGLHAVLNTEELTGSEASARLDALLEEQGTEPGAFLAKVYVGSLLWLLIPLLLWLQASKVIEVF
ncbi:MAG: hypothetical protein RBU37_21150 [Myxococcota bacterium]|jgi:hypothetical protein|nr:hypothetical protein [Myxococcota bacterium]